MPKFIVYGKVIATKLIGVFEADDEGEALEMASESENMHVSLCHRCAGEAEEAYIDELFAEKHED